MTTLIELLKEPPTHYAESSDGEPTCCIDYPAFADAVRKAVLEEVEADKKELTNSIIEWMYSHANEGKPSKFADYLIANKSRWLKLKEGANG